MNSIVKVKQSESKVKQNENYGVLLLLKETWGRKLNPQVKYFLIVSQ